MESNSQNFKRIKVEDENNLVKIIIKPKLRILTALILLVLSFIWSTSGLVIFTELYTRNLNIINNSYIFLWFMSWFIGQLFFVYAIFWRVTGKEILVKTPLTLQYINDIAGFSTMRTYELNRVENISTMAFKTDIYKLLGIEFLSPQRNVKFNYNGLTKDFGINLSLEEANYIMNILQMNKSEN